MAILRAVQFVCRVNRASELDGPHFELENFFGESELSGGFGWNLIAMDGNVICNIGRNKSDTRNMKNRVYPIRMARLEATNLNLSGH